MATVTKRELIDRIADEMPCKRVLVKRIIQRFLDEIIKELSHGSRLEFRDFGVFESKHRASRIAQNPKTLERVPVPAKRTVKFRVGRVLRHKLKRSTSSAIPALDTPANPASPAGRRPG